MKEEFSYLYSHMLCDKAVWDAGVLYNFVFLIKMKYSTGFRWKLRSFMWQIRRGQIQEISLDDL